ncbi:AAA family ATPase [Clostridium perfringens]|nr:AAA family ATPase [Clostridium perfringens]MDK0768118.1 AAA family ATPase [Clostridium perfringens]MDK0770764.1 AAA family ATPase [Clostridium perfringens]MDK0775789.1 AAA family ATPase [Clostridium perfringens]
MNNLQVVFGNIESFYRENKKKLLEDDKLRPCKSITRNIFATIEKFKNYYLDNAEKYITKDIITKDILELKKWSDVVSTNIRVMKEFDFIKSCENDIYEFTDEFFDYLEEKISAQDYFERRLKSISSINEMDMISNTVLCTLREAYTYGEIVLFPESKDDFHKAITDKNLRLEYCERVNELYGFCGRRKNVNSDDYTPNANYRIITVLTNMNLIYHTGDDKYLKKYNLCDKGLLLLKEIDLNLSNNSMNFKKNEKLIKENNKILKYKKFKDNKIFKNNRIIFGAPGTGKSFKLNKEIEYNELEKQYRRVTFHPNYTYSQFVGSYKPIGNDDGTISYKFVGGPFLKTLIESLRDEKEGIPHILIIEEINRANPAAVFGDIFQLLDRNSEGESTYTINMSSEMKKYVNKELGNNKDELYIPNNMYIWATMNSADQGVYPMDSAFKRRWSFEYIDIDENEEKLKELGCEIIEVPTEMIDSEGNRIYKKYEWNEVRKTINEILKENKINEDKLLGPFFLSEKELKESRENFDNIFKSKVLMYLYEDILKHKNIQFFKEDDERKVNTLCDIMRNYDLGKIFTFELNEYKEIKEVIEDKGDEIKEPIGV